VHKDWKTSGAAVINSNFARLTPDRQSKKGALWSKKPLAVDSFSAILKFRISGQAKNFFGDGIALWIMQQSYYKEGSLHAVDEKFVGVGIIFDTFRNTETLNAHRDVTVIVNDGEKSWEMMTADVKGCEAMVRYHSDRDDFSVSDSSRAKVVVENRGVTVYVDATNSGEWSECVSLKDIDLPDFWARKAHIGLTASTGQLADNHDVLSLSTFSDSDHATVEAEEQSMASKKAFPLGVDLSDRERIMRVENAINDLMEKVDFFDHHMEHELASVEDNIKSLLSKIEKREDKSEFRIESIESEIREKIEGTMDARLKNVEDMMKRQMDNKMGTLTNALGKSMDQKLKMSTDGAQGWKLPFIILIVLLVACSIGLYLFYLNLKKTHLL
jgi:mannose-binding lectin 2